MCYAALLEQVHKRGHPVDGLPLCVKVNVKLQTFQAVAILEINWITQAFSSDEKVHANQSAGSLIKDPIREALSLLMDIADACITSPWRRLKSCEALFEAVVTGVARVSAYQSSQMLKILLLRFKTLVLAICAQVCDCKHTMVDFFLRNYSVQYALVFQKPCRSLRFASDICQHVFVNLLVVVCCKL
jgi:phosphatidylinositol 4-kinase